MKKFSITTFIAAVILSAASPANAHSQLKEAVPATGSAAATAPGALRIAFSEGIVPAFSGAEIANDKGEKQATGKYSFDIKP